MQAEQEEERLVCAVCLKFEADNLPQLEEHWGAVHFRHYLPDDDSDEEDEADHEDDGVTRDQGKMVGQMQVKSNRIA